MGSARTNIEDPYALRPLRIKVFYLPPGNQKRRVHLDEDVPTRQLVELGLNEAVVHGLEGLFTSAGEGSTRGRIHRSQAARSIKHTEIIVPRIRRHERRQRKESRARPQRGVGEVSARIRP